MGESFRIEAYRERTDRRRHLGAFWRFVRTAPGSLLVDAEVIAWAPAVTGSAEPFELPLGDVEGMRVQGDPYHGRVRSDLLLAERRLESIWFDGRAAARSLTDHLESRGWAWADQPTRPGEPVLRPPAWLEHRRR